jgi:hypothetical protein
MEMEFKGTKKKWQISTNNEVGVLISTHPMSRDICTVWKYDNNFLENQETKANALLIAKAPEMLEFLMELYNDKETHSGMFPSQQKKLEKLIKEATEL